jgi:hypothetical protein
MSILDNFYRLSGQEVSREKTSILFSKNVDIGAREALVNLSGYKEVHTLGKFLGVPLVGKAPRKTDYNYTNIGQVKAKLASWKGKQLSFGGHITLSSGY